MAVVEVVIPKMGMATDEVDFVRWLVRPGQRVEAGAQLAEVESEKATLAIEAETAGTVKELLVEEGQVLRVGDVICRLEPV